MAASPALRAVVKSAPVQHAIVTYRAARILTPAPRFVAGQMGRCEAVYAVRGTGAKVRIRHRTRDAAILVEILGPCRSYQPPAGAAPLLEGSVRVLDLGGNIGLFGIFALAHWNVRELHSFEPEPDNYRLLTAPARDARWTTEAAAVSNAPGSMRFMTGMFSESRAAEADESGIDVPVVDVFEQARCDLLKIDIEGGEWPILSDRRLKGFARVIVMEWHGRGAPERDAHGAARRLLAEAGYTHQFDEPNSHEGNGLLWAWT